MPPPHHKRHGSRSRSPGHRRRHSHSRSPSPGKHHPHSRSNSPKHGRKHGRGKKHGHGHGPKHHGPPKSAGCGKFEDVWWDDLPDKAVKKAKILGYNERKWDGDKDAPCFKKKFVDLKMKEKRAVAYLGLDIFEEHRDLDKDWDDLDDEIKEFATKLGYDQDMWDNDEDPSSEDKDWDDLTEDEVEGAKYFGYNKATWNDGDDDEDDSDEEEDKEASEEEDEVEEIATEQPIDDPEAPAPEASAPPLPDEAPEEAEPETKAEAAPVVAAVVAPVVAAATASVPAATAEEEEEEAPPKFFMSRNFGGEGGSAFDHMNRRRITKITVRAGKFVDGISTTYMNGETLKNGGDGGEEQSMVLSEGEYINEVKLREGNVIQSITFITNKGNQLGPCGSGKGGGLFAKEGNGVQVKAPDGYRLVGLKGREGKWLDAIGFRWGPVPARFL